MRRGLIVLGRALLSVQFITGGWAAAREPGRRVVSVERIGLPEPELLVRVNGGAMVLGGIALALGFKPRWAAALLAALLVPTTYAGHRFWTMDPGPERAQQTIQFCKNATMLGGLVVVTAGTR
jgi:uncharacterized membrane protein YphA (DoxX/SURF4 family)